MTFGDRNASVLSVHFYLQPGRENRGAPARRGKHRRNPSKRRFCKTIRIKASGRGGVNGEDEWDN